MTSFENAVIELYPSIFSFIRSRIYDKSCAEDVTHEVFLILCSKQHDYDPNKSFKAWCFSIARFQILKFITNCKRNKEHNFASLYAEDSNIDEDDLPSNNPNPFQIFNSKERSLEKQQAIKSVYEKYMTPKEKCFFCCEFSSLSKEDTCKIMNLSHPHHYYVWRTRIRSRLKKHVGEFIKL